METLQIVNNFIAIIKSLSATQIILIIVAGIIWIGGVNYLKKKHFARLVQEGKTPKHNLVLNEINLSEYLSALLLLVLAFCCLITAIYLGQ
jgi:hypothetical protein